MLDYNLGDMRDRNGTALRDRAETGAVNIANAVAARIARLPAFARLSDRLGSPKLPFYYKFVLKREIASFVKRACVIEWYLENKKYVPTGESAVPVPDIGIYRELAACWPFKGAPVKLVGPASFEALKDDYCREAVIRHVKRRVKASRNGDGAAAGASRRRAPAAGMNNAACHFNEGLDTKKRNDISWFLESGISPDRLILYFDEYSKNAAKDDIARARKLGVRCIGLTKKWGRKYGIESWEPGKEPSGWYMKPAGPGSAAEEWMLMTGNDLLKSVHFWKSFYADFGIRLLFAAEEMCAHSIAQCVAFDSAADPKGLLIGRQRSDMFSSGWDLGRYTKHVLFTWNVRAPEYIKPENEHVDAMVASGYPYEIVRGQGEHVSLLRDRGVKFIVALFDSNHGVRRIQFSTGGMAAFYEAFMNWALEDSEVGIIVKSKKSGIVETLPEKTRGLIEKAEAAGRCVRLTGLKGRLPSEASAGSDMAVGIGISSAVTEAVIGGARGVHYDLPALTKHEYYGWGRGTLVFDDLAALMAALRAYRKDKTACPGLGDWTAYMDRLDPFRDNKGAARMGEYAGFLLNGFDGGNTANGALGYANTVYAEKWGHDKIKQTNEKGVLDEDSVRA